MSGGRGPLTNNSGGSKHGVGEDLWVARVADANGLRALGEHEILGPGQDAQLPRADQRLVDRAHPAAEDGPDRRAERHRLTVHRAPGADDEVRESDEALCVDRAAGDDDVGCRSPGELLTLALG